MARSPLVAPKRSASKKKAKGNGSTRTTKKTSTASRKRRAPRGLMGWILLPFRVVFGVLFRLAWRGALVMALILGLAVGYVYTTLPAPQAILDGRSQGSVTLLDRYGDIFAWRGF